MILVFWFIFTLGFLAGVFLPWWIPVVGFALIVGTLATL